MAHINNIINICQHIFETLGPGFSERVYHNALEIALRKNDIPYETERTITIQYEGYFVGYVRADLVIDGHTVVELKSTNSITKSNTKQLDMYMRHIPGITQGLLINFPQGGSADTVEHYLSTVMA